MEPRELNSLLSQVAAGKVDAEEAQRRITASVSEADLGFAKVDTSRGLRTGVSEVIYGAGKSAEQISGIVCAMCAAGQQRIVITCLEPEKAEKLEGLIAGAEGVPPLRYHPEASWAIVGEMPKPDGVGSIAIAAAGTSDIPVAEEAALTAEALGNTVCRLYDVGVAGIHRLLSHAEDVASATCVIAVAGMEGALPSVVAGMTSSPLIAVPTSVGYGANFNGLAPLLAMLNSCASGVSVVNIDNGFGAGFQASLINHVGLR